MAPRSTRSWQVVRAELPIDEARVAAYALILEAQDRIAAARSRAGVADVAIDAALEECEPANPESLSPRDLYLTTVERFVSALGGWVDGSARFGEDPPIALPAAPD